MEKATQIHLNCHHWFHTFFTMTFFMATQSRLMVVSREAKKGQSDRQKQNAGRTTVCLLHKRMFSSFDVIITVNISRSASTFKHTLKTQNLLANVNQHPKDKRNWLSSLSFPAWSKLMNFVFFSLTEVASSPF